VVVENKPGAGGILGNQLVASATPDGYTLGIMTAGQIIAAVTRKDMPYDSAVLTPVSQVASGTFLIVTRPNFPANSVVELIAAAKAAPGKIILASPGFAAISCTCRFEARQKPLTPFSVNTRTCYSIRFLR
jgi:tripartite-type tricarboxylate transporter receptor subunit TctC